MFLTQKKIEMKKLILLAFLAIGMTANAETVFADNDDDVEKSLIDLGKGADKNDRWSMHLQVGVDVPTNVPDNMSFAPFRSWEIGWTVAQYDYTPKKWKTTFSAGLGLNWRNYTLKGHKRMFEKDGNVVDVSDADDEYSDLSSSIHTVSLSIPLLVKQRFAKSFAVSVGAQLNWNYYARVNNEYEVGDDDCDVSTKKIGQRPFTVDILGIIDISDFCIYCKYSPMSVLKNGRGPEFKSLAFGIYF